MTDDTENVDRQVQRETAEARRPAGDGAVESEELATSGYIERTILHHLAGSDASTRTPSTVGSVVPAVAEVIRRGNYANLGPRGAEDGTVRRSTIRRAFTQLDDKGLVQRVGELEGAQLDSEKYDLGECDGDVADPNSYARTSDDARVTDWILTDEGQAEIERLDTRYEAELDDLAARYGRPRGETRTRIEG